MTRPAEGLTPIHRDWVARAAVFLFHGTQDALVAVAQAIALAQAPRERKARVRLRVFEAAGHAMILPNPHLAQPLEALTRFVAAVDAGD